MAGSRLSCALQGVESATLRPTGQIQPKVEVLVSLQALAGHVWARLCSKLASLGKALGGRKNQKENVNTLAPEGLVGRVGGEWPVGP